MYNRVLNNNVGPNIRHRRPKKIVAFKLFDKFLVKTSTEVLKYYVHTDVFVGVFCGRCSVKYMLLKILQN